MYVSSGILTDSVFWDASIYDVNMLIDRAAAYMSYQNNPK